VFLFIYFFLLNNNNNNQLQKKILLEVIHWCCHSFSSCDAPRRT